MTTAIYNAVRVFFGNSLVDNTLPNLTLAQIDQYNSITQGAVWIGANNWKSTSKIPVMGDRWDNFYPASFVTPVPEPVDPDPAAPNNQTEAFALIAVAQSELNTANQASIDATTKLAEAIAAAGAFIPV